MVDLAFMNNFESG